MQAPIRYDTASGESSARQLSNGLVTLIRFVGVVGLYGWGQKTVENLGKKATQHVIGWEGEVNF
ncbi:uncharacterized protein BDCG_01801 [Blastomyces dermatitidis ER-3]|uniref:Uncharacterized protein n=2 Tax=Ajellomyces dermatitidis TaxID=5039 RepID=F2TLU7_AJEDA|nr:uncharacterized protein BDCG_01801 [Blastomyces dermatitidis ER-3]EEQ86681.2 hypothetical protein BDCG_01801 [Blastomyces dermatitidis ER-3]EGE84210.2 hypothetical protein BDDG_07155 [Blastomyces dermatitidis ATCC 18188]EQL30825.1 hypothetical protein BDFG_06706 [Blastomyces dermatitidis ATCC 26199]